MTPRSRTAVLVGTSLVAGLAVLAWVLVRYGEPALELLAAGVQPVTLAVFVLVAIVELAVYARRWQVILAGLGTACGLGALAALRAAGYSISALLPSAKLGGEPLRAFLLVRRHVPGAHAIASVAIDRVLEMGAAAAFACGYATLLLRSGVPGLQRPLVTVVLGAAALLGSVAVIVRRLRHGAGLVTAVARTTGLDRLRFVRAHLDVVAAAEEDAARLIAQRARIGLAFALGIIANFVVLLEYHVLLSAFALPAGPLAVVAAIFAAGAAHSLPVPAAVGALEGAQIWLFGLLGHPPEIGLAVGLAIRVRELVPILLGLGYLLVHAVRVGWESYDADPATNVRPRRSRET